MYRRAAEQGDASGQFNLGVMYENGRGVAQDDGNLLYTGITRGKRLVVLVGQRKAVAIAVKNVSGRQRWSKLDEWLGRGA